MPTDLALDGIEMFSGVGWVGFAFKKKSFNSLAFDWINDGVSQDFNGVPGFITAAPIGNAE